jgi:hypothetical protein
VTKEEANTASITHIPQTNGFVPATERKKI